MECCLPASKQSHHCLQSSIYWSVVWVVYCISLFYKHEWKMESEGYDSSDKHRFQKAAVPPTESGRSFTWVCDSVGSRWLTVCSQVKRIKQHPEMSSSCLKLVPERQELSRDFIMFLRSLNGNSLIIWITTLRPSCIIRLQHFNDVYANRKLPTFLKSLIENIVK